MRPPGGASRAAAAAAPRPPPPAPPPPPRLARLVVVEGASDKHALLRAVDAEAFVLRSATRAGAAAAAVRAAAERASPFPPVLLLDPDVAGRQARAALDAGLGGWCAHAFVPADAALGAAASGRHAAGNVGVEHAAPAALRAALDAARPGDAARRAFARAELQAARLVAEGAGEAGGVARRRHLVAARLGLGACNGKQLLACLNRYFSRAEFEAALAWAEAALAAEECGGE
jgi:5S rRNA maturation endonuclease (ribonuclease M5)